MKKIFVIILLIAGISFSNAQNRNDESSIEIYSKIELKTASVLIPVLWENKIYNCEKSGIVKCFDSSSSVIWQHNFPSEIVTAPLVADGMVTIGTISGEIISLTANNGDQIQSLGIDDSISTDLSSFKYEGDKELFLPKHSDTKTAIIFGTASGTIYCLDLETLQEYWRNNDIHGKIIHAPVINQNKILFAGTDGFLYSIDSRNGLLNWRWKETETTDFSDSKIVCDGKKVFAVSKDSQLYCIDLLLGKLIWKSEKIKFLPSIGESNDRKTLFAKSDDKCLVLISIDKETIAKQIKREVPFDSLRTQPVEYKGKIFFTNNGSIFTLDKKYKEEKIFDFGELRINIFQMLSNNKFLAVTSAGTILIFGVK